MMHGCTNLASIAGPRTRLGAVIGPHLSGNLTRIGDAIAHNISYSRLFRRLSASVASFDAIACNACNAGPATAAVIPSGCGAGEETCQIYRSER